MNRTNVPSQPTGRFPTVPQNRASSAVGKRSGNTIPLVLGALLAVGCLAVLVYFSFYRSGDVETIDAVLKPVIKDEFVAKVLDQGEVQSAENVEIKCQVVSRNGNTSVIDAIPEGTYVKAGDWLVTLDSAAFEQELEQQRIAVSSAQTSVIQSKAALDAALASKNEYEQGTFIEQKKTIENEKFNAEQEYEQAKAYLEHSINLQKKGFLSKQALQSDEIAVARAFNKVELETKRLEVLENITYKKEIVQLESDIAAAEVQYQNALEEKKIEDRKLAEIEEQLEFCNIKVPEGVEGEVVYHKEFDRRGGSEWVLEPGATVRERQVLIKLPNPNKMEVKVLINEQSITSVRPGMPATISVDALSSKPLTGYVTKVNSYAEQGGFMSSSTVREYAVFVRIIDPPKQLIPGMNASVTIQTQYQPDVLQAPLQCIYSANDTAFVLRQALGMNPPFETVEVQIAGENSQNVWIESGVEEGDMLVMDPGYYKDLMALPAQQKESRIELPEGTAVTSATAPGGPANVPVDGAGDSAVNRGPGGARR